MKTKIKKKFLTLWLAMFLLAVTLNGCAPKQTLSGKYTSADNSTLYLMFEGDTLTIYENDVEIDSGKYRFNNDNAIVFTFSIYAGNYTLDESKENLYFGSADDDNYGETAFTKVQGE